LYQMLFVSNRPGAHLPRSFYNLQLAYNYKL
jgi:hypothetical protein